MSPVSSDFSGHADRAGVDVEPKDVGSDLSTTSRVFRDLRELFNLSES